MSFRIERDGMGEVRIPSDALYGAQTQRAVDNFPISGRTMRAEIIHALGLVKEACATTNQELGRLDRERAAMIRRAAREVADGKLDAHFVVDVYQTGSGTSTNMNANEVIANRAMQLFDGEGELQVHPNDHVNMSQSSNDVIPSAVHIACAVAIQEQLTPSIRCLHRALSQKSDDFSHIYKSGRTHLMDATPMTVGQEFSGYAQQAGHALRRAQAAFEALMELPLGGTAVGTGLNRPRSFPERAVQKISERTQIPFETARNAFEAQAARDGLVEAHGQLNTIATSLTKIANDLRWLSSGPRTGLRELRLPATQPGSSIMPGKVNPVMSEMLTQVAARVVGNQATVTLGGMGGALELNAYIPVMADATLESILLLARGVRVFADRCVAGIEVDREICERSVARNLSISTALAPVLGYDQAASIAKEAHSTGRTIREVAIARDVLPVSRLDELLDPAKMIEPDPD
ncbi:MAG: class II fumarate hydratase [Deltaproteobacteria bacterium]|nr:MAG: class II fumarate hydratase [Deltaproteobacteria bacterium]